MSTRHTGLRPPPRRARVAEAFPLPVAVILGLVLACEVIAGLVLWRPLTDLAPHDVPGALVAPPVVAGQLVAEIESLPGHPFSVFAASDAGDVRSDVERGDLYGALVVDLRGTTHTVFVSTVRDPQVTRAIRVRVENVMAARGARVEVTEVGPADAGARRDRAHWLSVAGLGLGFLAVVGVGWARGPYAADARRGVGRVAGLGLGIGTAGALLGLVAALGSTGERLATGAGVGALAMGVALTTMALQAVFGWTGLGLAVVGLVGSGLPVLARVDPYLLGGPWRVLTRLGVPGAGSEAVLGGLSGQPRWGAEWAVLGAWTVAAVVTLWLAGRVRRRTLPAERQQAGRALTRVWRLRVLALVVPLTALLVGATVLVPRHTVASTAVLPPVATSTTCLATGAVSSVADLNRIAALRGGPLFRGGDVGADALLQDGRRVWMFGDTLRGEAGALSFVRNSMLVLGPDCIQAVRPAGNGAIIPDRVTAGAARQPAVGYWPMATVADHRDGFDLVYVTAQRVRTTGSGSMDFENLGASVAVFVVPRGGVPQLMALQDIGADRAGRAFVTWGAAATLVSDGGARYLYLFGTANPSADLVFGYSLRVARVPVDAVLDAGAWTYWDGRSWVADEAAAAVLIPAVNGVSQTLSVFPVGERWYAVSKRDDFLGKDLTVWSAPSATGPWDGGKAVAPLVASAPGQVRYMPLAHPDLFPEPGSVVVSYSSNNLDLGVVSNDPLQYRPTFLRIRLP